MGRNRALCACKSRSFQTWRPYGDARYQWLEVKGPDHVRPVQGYQDKLQFPYPNPVQVGRKETNKGKSIQKAFRPLTGQGVDFKG